MPPANISFIFNEMKTGNGASGVRNELRTIIVRYAMLDFYDCSKLHNLPESAVPGICTPTSQNGVTGLKEPELCEISHLVVNT